MVYVSLFGNKKLIGPSVGFGYSKGSVTNKVSEVVLNIGCSKPCVKKKTDSQYTYQ